MPPTIKLIYKKGDDTIPSNYRMIALSNTCGKRNHQILAQRAVSFLTTNNFIDKTVQKAFLNRINGTIEHNQVLLEMIRHAKANRKTLHMTFFDLENALAASIIC